MRYATHHLNKCCAGDCTASPASCFTHMEIFRVEPALEVLLHAALQSIEHLEPLNATAARRFCLQEDAAPAYALHAVEEAY